MLVVLGLLLILAALAVAFVPKMNERQKTARGADQLQGWLLIARQWARRDGVPTGIRIQSGTLYPNPVSPNTSYRHDLQYIQQPPAFYAGTSSYLNVGAGSTATVVQSSSSGTTVDFSNGNSSDPNAWILANPTTGTGVDFVEVPVGGPTYRIKSLSTGANGYDTMSFGNTSPSSGSYWNYRILRAPRVLAGEGTLQMPKDVAIDVNTNVIFGSNVPINSYTGNLDIIFSPAGGVIGQGAVSDKILLWVRDVTQDLNQSANNVTQMLTTAGDQTVITIYVRTGFIAAHPVDTSVNTSLTAGSSSGGPVTVQVASAANISPGNYLMFDPGVSASQETAIVTNVAGTSVTVGQLLNTHNAGAQVISDPYGFAKDGRSSGL
jgi:Tfp pilus assembly protein FimT